MPDPPASATDGTARLGASSTSLTARPCRPPLPPLTFALQRDFRGTAPASEPHERRSPARRSHPRRARCAREAPSRRVAHPIGPSRLARHACDAGRRPGRRLGPLRDRHFVVGRPFGSGRTRGEPASSASASGRIGCEPTAGPLASGRAGCEPTSGPRAAGASTFGRRTLGYWTCGGHERAISGRGARRPADRLRRTGRRHPHRDGAVVNPGARAASGRRVDRAGGAREADAACRDRVRRAGQLARQISTGSRSPSCAPTRRSAARNGSTWHSSRTRSGCRPTRPGRSRRRRRRQSRVRSISRRPHECGTRGPRRFTRLTHDALQAREERRDGWRPVVHGNRRAPGRAASARTRFGTNLDNGTIDANTLIFTAGMANWTPLSDGPAVRRASVNAAARRGRRRPRAARRARAAHDIDFKIYRRGHAVRRGRARSRRERRGRSRRADVHDAGHPDGDGVRRRQPAAGLRHHGRAARRRQAAS